MLAQRISDNEQGRTSYEIDLIHRNISTENANKIRVNAVVRKRSFLGLGGWVYYLERASRRSSKPGEIRLYGGRVEYKSPEHKDNKEDATSAAIMRELNEEIGEYKEETSDRSTFGAGQFDFFTSIYGKAENGEWMAVDIYRLEEVQVRPFMGFWIRKNQRDKRKAFDQKKSELANEKAKLTPDLDKISELEGEIEHLKECVEAGSPIKVRDFHGLWLRIDFDLSWLWPMLDWRMLSPIAAYALMMDRRVRASR